jgi:hypothetical protein
MARLRLAPPVPVARAGMIYTAHIGGNSWLAVPRGYTTNTKGNGICGDHSGRAV